MMNHGDTETRRLHWELTDQIVGACIEVHRHLGPGLLESAYEACLAVELRLRDLPFVRQLEIPVFYKGSSVDEVYRVDFFVAGAVVLELKAVGELKPVHEAQLLTYLRLTGARIGLLVNFNVPTLKRGVRRFIR